MLAADLIRSRWSWSRRRGKKLCRVRQWPTAGRLGRRACLYTALNITLYNDVQTLPVIISTVGPTNKASGAIHNKPRPSPYFKVLSLANSMAWSLSHWPTSLLRLYFTIYGTRWRQSRMSKRLSTKINTFVKVERTGDNVSGADPGIALGGPSPFPLPFPFPSLSFPVLSPPLPSYPLPFTPFPSLQK